MSEPLNTDQQRAYKSKIYFAIAGAFLLLMGLVWSLDAFFVYITLGASLFFFFLAFRNRSKLPDQPRYYERTRQNPPQNQKSQSQTKSATFDELLKEFTKDRTEQQGSTHSASPNKSRATVIVAMVFVFFTFTIIFISIIFSESEDVDLDATIYYNTGEQFLWDQQFDSAKVYYRRALRVQPDYPEALNGYGNALMGLNNYDSAIIMMTKALEARPDYDYAKYSRALVYFYKQNYKQSRKELFGLMENTPDYYDAMVLAGDDYYVEQRNDSAFYWYQKAYDNGVRSAGLSRVLAEIHDTRGNRDKAIDLYKESLSYDSTNTQIYNRLSELLPNRDGDVYRAAGRKWKQAGY